MRVRGKKHCPAKLHRDLGSVAILFDCSVFLLQNSVILGFFGVVGSRKNFRSKHMNGDVVFDHVDFGYTEDRTVLHDIEIFARPGQKVAFVGATGAGKTTITNLLNRFYDIQDGKIRYDGISINKIQKADLRHSLGIVLQDTHLFTGMVMDNIRYGKLNATEEVIKAAKLANAHDFIMKLPNGYQTVLKSSGGSLSQGQRQLLAIARVAVADPPVLILDEATSSIDTRTEKIVQDGSLYEHNSKNQIIGR